MQSTPEIQDNLLQASRVAARLLQDGLRVEEIRIQGRAQPAVRIRDGRGNWHLHGYRYAWGRDSVGRFERFATRLDGVQIQWEVRHCTPQTLEL